MNFEGFKDLIHRVVTQWWQLAKKEIVELDFVTTYLEESPFKAKQTPGNEIAYEKLMDVRVKLYVSATEVRNHRGQPNEMLLGGGGGE